MTLKPNHQTLNYLNFTQKELDVLFIESKAGNSEAFSSLSSYIRHISYSYFISKYRQGRIINKDDVDDLSNNVYLSFAEQYHKIDNIEFWLRRVLFLNFVNWNKKNSQYKNLELEEARHISHEGITPGEKLDAEKILSIVDTLNEEKQKIIKMRFWEDLKFSEIAENLNKSEDAVKKMFYRTIDELKSKI
ncbi:MAG: sigma-70 family RNA polymerase sigma factor [Ignavibacteriaceae bacterium]|nr:sigma-70 family RNA polymerase sigma factor [Ignavibacteriaceae bacterium]